MQSLKVAFQGLEGARDHHAIEQALEPLLSGLTEEDRRALGEQLWNEFYADFGKEREEPYRPYPFTGLAEYFCIPLSGS